MENKKGTTDALRHLTRCQALAGCKQAVFVQGFVDVMRPSWPLKIVPCSAPWETIVAQA